MKSLHKCRFLLASLATAGTLVATGAVHANATTEWPEIPVETIAGFGSDGPTDVLARILVEGLAGVQLSRPQTSK
jgi:tripartite-type tricarboxylate transporter receptor subunit TctC